MIQLIKEEKEEFIRLTEKKLGIIELTKHLDIIQNKALYNQVIQDLGETTRVLDSLWLSIKKKHNLINVEDRDLTIDFEKGTISKITTPIDRDLKIF